MSDTRNTALDARGYFDPTCSAYKQNQFGGGQGSNLGEQFDPLDALHIRTISAWDTKHAFICTYQITLPMGDTRQRRQ